jgi:hypothetical protein
MDAVMAPTVDAEAADTLPVPDVDIRSDADKAADAAMGLTEQSDDDRKIAKIVKAADELFNNTKATRKYLSLGELCYDFVYTATEGGETGERAACVKRIEERVRGVAGIQPTSIRVNDWIAVYWLARLVTGTARVKDMDGDWCATISYHTLADLKVGIERAKDETWLFKSGWEGFLRNAILSQTTAAPLRGEALAKALKDHSEMLEQLRETEKAKRMSPEQVQADERRQQRKEREETERKLQKSIDVFEDKVIEAGLVGSALRDLLERREIIPKVEVQKVPMDLADMARTMTPQDAIALVEFLRKEGNAAAIATLFQQTRKIMEQIKAHAEAAAAA